MLTNTIKILVLGGRVAAVTTLLGTTALAQNAAVVETEEGNVAVVPEAATTTQSSIGSVSSDHLPIFEQIDNDQTVAETLLAQGFTNIHIKRQGALMTVNAQRNGQPTELVYSIANGSLVSVDGVELRAAPEPNRGESSSRSTAEAAPADPSTGDPDAGDPDTGAPDTGTDDGSTDGTDAGGEAEGDGDAGSDGSDASSDTGESSDSDTSSEGGTGSEGDSGSGGDSGSDGDGADSGGTNG